MAWKPLQKCLDLEIICVHRTNPVVVVDHMSSHMQAPESGLGGLPCSFAPAGIAHARVRSRLADEWGWEDVIMRSS